MATVITSASSGGHVIVSVGLVIDSMIIDKVVNSLEWSHKSMQSQTALVEQSDHFLQELNLKNYSLLV